MITTARQLKDLIRNMSKKKSADAQILMRNYMMERFLERISLSEYKDKFILKGGMLVAAMVGLDARATMDLDATIKGANVSLTDVETIISNIITIPIDDGVSFCIKRISEIMEEADYPGVRVSMETKFDGVITPLKIDISTGDVITPKEIRYSFNLMLGGIETPDKGSIIVNGFDVAKKGKKQKYFKEVVGFLFQNFALLENKTVKENLEIIKKSGRTDISINEALEKVGLQKVINKKVYQLSGGEQQRVPSLLLLLAHRKQSASNHRTS